jgi:hypothetical protein
MAETVEIPLNNRGLLAVSALVTILIWQIPMGHHLLYPFTILATFAHEMGHGLMARLLGASFDGLEMYPSGAGLAHWHGNLDPKSQALVALAGLLGAPVAGAVLLVASRRTDRSKGLLRAFAFVLILASILWVRPAFAVFFCVLAGVFFGLVSVVAPRKGTAFLLQMISVQLMVASFKDFHYIFSRGAEVEGVFRPSDTQVIAQLLPMPHVFWALFVCTATVGILLWGIYASIRTAKA